MLGREDVERIIKNVLSELRLEVDQYGDQWHRKLSLTYQGNIISTVIIDIGTDE